jgi:hypothetical protein
MLRAKEEQLKQKQSATRRSNRRAAQPIHEDWFGEYSDLFGSSSAEIGSPSPQPPPKKWRRLGTHNDPNEEIPCLDFLEEMIALWGEEDRVALAIANACKDTAYTAERCFESAVRALNHVKFSFLPSNPFLKPPPPFVQLFHTKAIRGFLFSNTSSILEYMLLNKFVLPGKSQQTRQMVHNTRKVQFGLKEARKLM